MSRFDNYGYSRGRRGSTVLWIFVGIVAFTTLFYPFFGGNLRYGIGNFISGIFFAIGRVLFIGGIFLLMIGFVAILFSGLKGIKIALLGLFLMILGSLFMEPGNFGLVSQGKPAPKGYH